MNESHSDCQGLHQPRSAWRHHGHRGGGPCEATHRELPADQGPAVQRQDKAGKEQDTNRLLKPLKHEWCRNLFSEVTRKHHHHVPLPGHRAPDSRAKSRGVLAAHLLPHHGQPPELLAPGRKAQISDLCGSRWAVPGARSLQAEGNGGKATALNLMVEISRAKTARSGRQDRSRESTGIPRNRRHRWR